MKHTVSITSVSTCTAAWLTQVSCFEHGCYPTHSHGFLLADWPVLWEWLLWLSVQSTEELCASCQIIRSSGLVDVFNSRHVLLLVAEFVLPENSLSWSWLSHRLTNHSLAKQSRDRTNSPVLDCQWCAWQSLWHSHSTVSYTHLTLLRQRIPAGRQSS